MCLARTERCNMCSGLHRAQECLTKVQSSVTVTLKCGNWAEEHSANSNRCPVLREKIQIKMNNATRKSRTAVSKPSPPLVTSGELPTIPTSDNRKKILTESLLKTGKSFAAISHGPRSVTLAALTPAARSSMRKTTNMTAFESARVNQRSNSKQHAVNQDSKITLEQQSLKQVSNNKQTEQQSVKQDNRKRSADQSLKSKEQIVGEVVTTTYHHSQLAADTAGTFNRIFTVMMTQIEQLRPLLTVENPGAKKIMRKMITSIKELLDDLLELQTQ